MVRYKGMICHLLQNKPEGIRIDEIVRKLPKVNENFPATSSSCGDQGCPTPTKEDICKMFEMGHPWILDKGKQRLYPPHGDPALNSSDESD